MKNGVDKTENSSQKAGKGRKDNWRAVTLGGVTGILMGVSSKAFASMLGETAEGVDPDDNPTGATDSIDIPVAGANGEQSFGDAFAEARENLGAGGVFEWRGRLYNTYTAEEWQEMTADEQDGFADKLKPYVAPDPIDDIIPGGGEDSLPPDDELASDPSDEEDVPVPEEDDEPVPEDEADADDDDKPVAEVVDEEHEQDYSNDESVAEEDEPAITEEEQEMLEELDENTGSYVTSIDEVGSGMEDYMSSVAEPDPLV